MLELYKSKGYNTFLFQYTNRGLLSADGSTPSEILDMCQQNEDFRVRCVVALKSHNWYTQNAALDQLDEARRVSA